MVSKKRFYLCTIYNAFYKVANIRKTSQIYNVGAGKPVSINKLVNLIGGNEFIQKDQENWYNMGKYFKIMKDAKWNLKYLLILVLKKCWRI